MRLCYNSQEEIWKASLEIEGQIKDIKPNIGKQILPPGTISWIANSTPKYQEQKRFFAV